MPAPITLVLETSQRSGGVALADRSGAIHVEAIDSTKRHDDDLMPAIDRVVAAAGLTPRDLEAVGVSIGPGGFTGLRLAVTTAKMLAETLGVKVVAVPSALVATASQAEPTSGDMLVALAGKQDPAWVTRVHIEGGAYRIVGEPGLAIADQLDLHGIEAVIADRYLPPPIREACEEAGVLILEPTFDPAACLRLALAMLEAGKLSDPLTLSPLYPRPPEAVSLWEQRRSS